VAVKVQYPGAAEALLTDVGTLSALVPVMRAAAPGLDARQLVAELRDRLAAEVDYAQEARAQTAFAAAYRDDPDIAVPDVLAVAGQVLVTRAGAGHPVGRRNAAGADHRRGYRRRS
jgi:predicted unusual protein kinase regulating ubiquinone biosynthesis (AarF/ABC1/UbiB family)